MRTSLKRWGMALWVVAIAALALTHLLHLSADFPNYSPWYSDWAKYTDEGWYGNAAIRAQLFGHWYMPGDFNPAPAVPVWPFLEWLLFGLTGVSVVAARALAVCFFFADLGLAYALVRTRTPRWAALLAVTLAVTSPFLYSFSRLAILEPMLMAFLLAALNLAVRLPRSRRPVLGSVVIGLLFTLMLLSKTSAAFLLPAVAWSIWSSLREERQLRWRCAAAAAAASALSFAGWMAVVMRAGLLRDYRYLFFINKYIKPHEWYWPLMSFWWSLHGVMWADRILLPLAGILVAAVAVGWRTAWSRDLRQDAAFGACFLAAAGYILFMTYQNHPQPRYYTVVALFSFLVLVMGVEALVRFRVGGDQALEVSHPRDGEKSQGWSMETSRWNENSQEHTSGAKALISSADVLPGINPRPTAPHVLPGMNPGPTESHALPGISPRSTAPHILPGINLRSTAPHILPRMNPGPTESHALPGINLRSTAPHVLPGTNRQPTARIGFSASLPAVALLVGAVAAAALNGVTTFEYAAHPQYTFLDAVRQLTRYIDQHPNGNRMLVSISGDEITLMTHLPTLCDDFGTEDLPSKLAAYEPGWWATWNDIDPGTLEDLHIHHSLEQVASFHALDDPERNVLVLFKLHRLPGEAREVEGTNLQAPLPGDRIEIPIQ